MKYIYYINYYNSILYFHFHLNITNAPELTKTKNVIIIVYKINESDFEEFSFYLLFFSS